ILAAHGRCHSARQADCHRQRRTVHEHIPAHAHTGHPGALESNDPEETSLPADTIGVPGPAASGSKVWSGDVYSSYWGLRHQVAAGLNFALSGYPYWTTDIGGYWPPHDNPIDDPKY